MYIFLAWMSKRRPVTLVYHSVGRVDPSQDPYRLSIIPERFEEHLKIISKSRDAVKISFDDGYGNNYDSVFPLLEKYGLTATIFLITDFIDGKIVSQKFGGRGLSLRPLTWDEIKAMDRAGIIFGSHTKSHPKLSSLSRDAVREELMGSKERIEELLGHKIYGLAYPSGYGGSFNPMVTEVAKEVGYKFAYTNMMGSNNYGKEEGFGLRRVRIYSEDGPMKLKMKLRGAYDWVDLPFIQRLFVA